jgi:outer membrane murein-binding lipoprotein Lpp
MTEFLGSVANFGFPVVVASYLLMRMEKKVDNMTDAVNGKDGLSTQIKELNKVIDNLSRKVDKN